MSSREAALTETAAHTGCYHVSLALDRLALAAMGAVYVELLLSPNGSPGTTAELTNFVFAGGGIRDPWLNRGVTGDFKHGILMQCLPQSVAPQVLGRVDPVTARMAFDLRVSTRATKRDWFTIWLHAADGSGFPTSAGRPGLLGSVSWGTDGSFVPAGYVGNGMAGGASAAGFSCEVIGGRT